MKRILFWISSIFLLISCEKDITVDLPKATPALVVHAQIEPDSFLVVSLTRNSDYFAPFDGGSLQSLVNSTVSNATIIASDGTITDTLEALTLDKFVLNHYTFFNYKSKVLKGKFKGQYSIRIITPEFDISGRTTIPDSLPIDSLWWEPKLNPNNEPLDSQLVRLMYRYKDPITPGNLVRVFSKRNSEAFWSSDFRSLYEDALINGGTVIFPIRRGKEPRRFGLENPPREENGFFRRGDTIFVKWSSIDRATYDLWRTTESADSGGGGPFRTPVYIQSNLKATKGAVVGGFSGYGSLYYSLIVPNW